MLLASVLHFAVARQFSISGTSFSDILKMLLPARLTRSLVQIVNRRLSTQSRGVLRNSAPPSKAVTCVRNGSGGGSGYATWYRTMIPDSEHELFTKTSKILLALMVAGFSYSFYYHPYDVIPFLDNHVTITPDSWTDEELGVPPDDWADETDPVNFGLIKDHPYQKMIKE